MTEAIGNLKVFVIGSGSIGKRHIKNLRTLGVRYITAFDPRADRAMEAEAQSQVELKSSVEAGLADRPNIAVIATPTSLHSAMALQAAESGSHIFVEKPLSDRIDPTLDALTETLRRSGLHSLVGCNMRFHPGPLRVKQLIEQGKIGALYYAKVYGGSHLPDWHPWEDYREMYSAQRALGGGCVLDGIHEIDLAIWYVGEVAGVLALVSKISSLEIDVEDIASIILQHKDGQHSEIHLDYIQRAPGTRGCLVTGADGSIAWDWNDNRVRWHDGQMQEWQNEQLPPNWNLNDMYVAEMRHFLDVVTGTAESCNPVDNAAIVTRVALAAKRSSAEGQLIHFPQDSP